MRIPSLTTAGLLTLVVSCTDPVATNRLASMRGPSLALAGEDSRLLYVREGIDVRGSSIHLMHGDGSGDVVVLPNTGVRNAFVNLSRDGQRVVFSSDRDGNLELYTMNVDGSSQQRLTSRAPSDLWPAWSPDGQRIAWTCDINPFTREICVMDADGGPLVRLTNDLTADVHPNWSPDGEWIAFASSRHGVNTAEIYIMRPDGSDQRRLTTTGLLNHRPSWSPDGSRIAFRRLIGDVADDNWEIFVINADGTGERRLTDSDGFDGGPCWSPDGSMLAFASDRAGNRDTWLMNPIDGSALVQLTSDPLDETVDPNCWVLFRTQVATQGVRIALQYRDREADVAVPLNATGAAYRIEGLLTAPRTFSRVPLGRITDVVTRYGLPVGEYDLELEFGPPLSQRLGTGIEVVDPVRVSVREDQTTHVEVDVARFAGIVETKFTINGQAPGEGFSLCAVRQTHIDVPLTCVDVPASGDIRVLLPTLAQMATICPTAYVSRGLCVMPRPGTRPSPALPPPLSASFSIEVRAGRTTVAPPVDIQTQRLRISLFYRDRTAPPPSMPLSATGAEHWIEGSLRSRESGGHELGRIVDGVTVDGLAAGRYDLELRYGPALSPATSGGSSAFFEVPIEVRANVSSETQVDISEESGLLQGRFLINGAEPGAGFAACVALAAHKGGQPLTCASVASDGAFRVLLPRGVIEVTVCETDRIADNRCQSSPASRGAVPFTATATATIRAGTTQHVTIDAPTQGAEVTLTYTDRETRVTTPAADLGASYWIEGILASGRSVYSLGRVDDVATQFGMAVGDYSLTLGYGPASRHSTSVAGRLIDPVRVRVQSLRLTRVEADLGESTGIVEGGLALNGGDPGEGLSLCVYEPGKGGRLIFCDPLSPTGQFRLLMPLGDGTGRICATRTLTLQGCVVKAETVRSASSGPSVSVSFSYHVEAGRTTRVSEFAALP